MRRRSQHHIKPTFDDLVNSISIKGTWYTISSARDIKLQITMMSFLSIDLLILLCFFHRFIVFYVRVWCICHIDIGYHIGYLILLLIYLFVWLLLGCFVLFVVDLCVLRLLLICFVVPPVGV